MKRHAQRWASLAALGLMTLLAGCERPPVETVQRGFRGTGMELVYNPRTVAANLDKHKLPEAIPAADTSDPNEPLARDVYQNVKVLGDLKVGEFNRLMLAMTNWVAPDKGCVYCHNAANFADDSLYTKVVARRMVEMTQTINADWKPHVAATGVTCYTCHRGKPVPDKIWFAPLTGAKGADFIGGDRTQNTVADEVDKSSLPLDPYTAYLLKDAPVRVNGSTALPLAGQAWSEKAPIQAAEGTYAFMIHFSKALGVNCTYCHNSRSFSTWEGGPPQRVTAWHGIQMVRELNNEYMVPLTDIFPASRRGPTGDVAKMNCATCHQGAYKPLLGASMLQNHPELIGASAR
ncbi:photosynthetic reaction center cytochrome c subunit [Piscinibacter sp. Jin2]|uniref:Photosynthetic reaction center cytochrome c subunit n=1 Tax=Aquariibacter lacus TaxID=2801332 RepID=A0A9X1BN55_9BURK|nr:photosynthetic reaction center cytochrome PufC [Piscinibacter lacus]MBL0719280.1 photosynthetic reaction center cytochrome c subunit [Piscinibacter lacus]